MSEIRPEKLGESLPTSQSELGLVLWSYVSKLALCDLGLYHMYTSICVLMYLYYIYLLISAMMDLLSDEIPPKFYERLQRRILSKVGDRFAYGMGCWMWHGEKKIGKMDPLALYQNNCE